MAKKCKACGALKDITDFYKASTNKDGLNSKCKACISIENKAKHAANPEKFKQRDREYRQRNREKIITRKRNYWQKTRELQIQQKRQKRIEARKAQGIAGEIKRRTGAPKLTWPERRQRMQAIHSDFKKNRSRQSQEWKQRNKEKASFYGHRRRALKKQALGQFEFDEWKRLCGEFGSVCLACKEKKPLTVDHIIPLSMGGTNYLSNVQPLCLSCNCSKNNKIIDYRPYIPKWIELKLF